MRIMEFLGKEAISVDLKSKNKEGVIEELTDLLVASKKLDSENKQKVVKALLDREGLGSTGIGQGIAIPHAKSDGVKEVVAVFGKSNEGVEFDALDGKPVYLFFLLVAPTEASSLHIKALAKISRFLKHKYFRSVLRKVSSVDEVIKVISEEDTLGW